MNAPEQATQALNAGHLERALDLLLAAWREHRSPTLAKAIDALSAYLATGCEDIDPESDDDWQDTWQARARRRRPAELGVLLPHLARPPKGGVPRRLRLILGFGADPRIGAALVDMIAEPPTTASSNFSMWTELFRALPDSVDASAIPTLEGRKATRGGSSQFWTKLDAWIDAAIPKLAPPARLPRGWGAQLRAFHAALARLEAEGPPRLNDTAPSDDDATGEWQAVADLKGARTAIEAGDLASALDQLVGYWAGRRSPDIARVIERLGPLVDETEPAITGRTKAALHDAWMTAGERPRPRAVGHLLASLRDGKLTDVESRLETLLAWRPDPRVAQAMVAMTEDYMLGARDRLWEAVYDAIVHHADPRIAAAITGRHDRLLGPSILHRHRSEGRQIRRAHPAFLDAVAADHELPAERVVELEAIEAALAARLHSRTAAEGDDEDVERAMVEAIVADWDSDDPRLVYSDWLQSRQDALGRYIALDVALAGGKKVKGKRDKWFKANKDAIFGAIAPLVSWRHAFERGLPVELRIDTGRGVLRVGEDERRAMFTDLRWAFVRKLEVGYDADVGELFEHAPLWSLRELSRPQIGSVVALGRRRDPVPLRAINLSAAPDTPDDLWDQLAALTQTVPELETLAIMIWARSGGRESPPVRFFQSPWVHAIPQLRCGSSNTGGVSRVDEWIERMIRARCPVPHVEIIGPEVSGDIRQPELGVFDIDLTLDRFRWPDRDEVTQTVAMLEGLPRDHVRRVRLARAVIHDDVASRFDAALAGLPVEPVEPVEPVQPVQPVMPVEPR